MRVGITFCGAIPMVQVYDPVLNRLVDVDLPPPLSPEIIHLQTEYLKLIDPSYPAVDEPVICG